MELGYMPQWKPDFDKIPDIKKSEEALKKLREEAEKALDDQKAKEYAESLQKAAKSVQRSLGSMRRALAGFDELNRMNRLKSAASVEKTKEQRLLEYLNSVDIGKLLSRLQAVRGQLAMCEPALESLADRIYLTNQAIKLQDTVLARSAANWLGLHADILSVGTAQQRLIDLAVRWNSQASQMAVGSVTLKSALASLQLQASELSAQLTTAGLRIQGYHTACAALQETGSKLSSLLSVLRGRFMGLVDEQVQTGLLGGLATADSGLRQKLFLLQSYLQNGFFPQWKLAWSKIAGAAGEQLAGMPGTVKGGLNTTIDLFDRFLSNLTKGFNSFIQSQNQLQLKLGQLTGTPVSRIPMLVTPTIPRLAQGAVLPANQPFLAMVGDQKHGTNVEAPLATIQEAVALVMQDSVSANIAGHEATVAVLREILQAVLGISIGDDVIGAAMQRYRSKMAVVTGGAL